MNSSLAPTTRCWGGRGIVRPTFSACARRRQGASLCSVPAARGKGQIDDLGIARVVRFDGVMDAAFHDLEGTEAAERRAARVRLSPPDLPLDVGHDCSRHKTTAHRTSVCSGCPSLGSQALLRVV